MIVVNVREWTYRLFYFPQRSPPPWHLQQLAICERFSARRVLSLTTFGDTEKHGAMLIELNWALEHAIGVLDVGTAGPAISLRGLQTKRR